MTTMKKKKIFFSLCLVLSVLLGLTACSSEDSDSVSAPQPTKTQNGFYVYNLNFVCEAPVYNDEATTRAVTSSWNMGTSLFARFKSGSTYYIGYINIDKDGWMMISSTEFINMSTSGTCELYYFLESNGDNYYLNMETAKLDVYNNGSFVRSTDIDWNTDSIALTENTAIYATTTATYVSDKDNGWTIKATLSPMMWRMRFNGTNGTSITMPGSDNDIKYCSAFNWSASSASFSKTTKDVNLKVSGGYTPYIYGEFLYPSSDNRITVMNGSDTYTRTFKGSNLQTGTSGYFTVPTASNYSSNGWSRNEEIDPNATIQVEDILTFTDGVVMGWKLGSTANTFDYTVFTKSGAEGLTDDQLANEIYDTNPYTLEDADYIFKSTNSEWFKANTEYYLCAVAKNSAGVRGPVLRKLFKTNATSLPYAEISNIKAESTTKWSWNITLNNNAKSYYMSIWTGEKRYKSDWHFTAYYAYQSVISGDSTHDWTSVSLDLSQYQETCEYITICTWGVDANNNIGNPNVAFGAASSSSRSLSPANPSPQKDKMSPKQMSEMRKNMKIYRCNN